MNTAIACAPDSNGIQGDAAQRSIKSAPQRVTDCAYIDAAQLTALPASTRWVDARAKLAYQSVHIAQATSIDGAPDGAGHDVVVVIGSGWNHQEEQRACDALTAKGYARVVALRGGLRSWVRAGMPIWADGGGVAALDVAAPATAHAAAVRGDTRFIILPEGGQSLACPSDVPNLHCVSTYRQALRHLRQHAAEAVLMLSASAVDFARVRKALGKKRSENLILVAGGTEAVRTHFANYQSIAQSASQTLWIPCHRR